MIFISFFAVLIGWIIQGLIGLGSGIISTAILLFFFEAKTVVVSLSLLALVGTVYLSISNYRGNLFLKDIFVLAVFSFLGAGIGSYLLKVANQKIVEEVFGLVIIFTGLYDLFLKNKNIKFPKSLKIPFGALTGFLGGIISGLIGGAGPLYAFYLNQYFHSKEDFKFVISFIFVILNVERIVFYLSYPDLIEFFSSEIIIPGLLATVLGAYLGNMFTKGLSTDSFKKLVSLSITLFGVYFLIKGLSLP